jgi:dCMP deaminase
MTIRHTDWEGYFFDMVDLVASKSDDPVTQCGALVVGPDKEIRTTGYVGFPRGVQHLEDRLARPAKYSFMEHAERNAIYNAVRMGISLRGCCMYITAPPCAECARAIIQSGITRVVYKAGRIASGENDEKGPMDLSSRWSESSNTANIMFAEAGVEVYIVPA